MDRENGGVQGMVQSVAIKNFRGFEDFKVDKLAPINIVMGDNAVGKTALLEAIFLTLCGSAQKALNLRQWRGQDVTINIGTADNVVDAMYADLFHDPKSPEPISIELTGLGHERRALTIRKTPGDVLVPVTTNRHQRRKQKKVQTVQTAQAVTVPIVLTWTDEHGKDHESRVLLRPNGIEFAGTGETIPNRYMMIAANVHISASEPAEQFSKLKRKRDHHRFQGVFLKVFDQIKEITVDSVGNSPAILADVPWAKEMLPLPVLSGGTSRAAAILLAIAAGENGLVLVDEVESGIYHQRQSKFASGIVEMARAYSTQVIMTTHSAEWLDKFIEIVGENNSDIAFWRMERPVGKQPLMRRFTVSEFAAGWAAGEMR